MWFWPKWGIYLYVVSTIVIVIRTFLIFTLEGAATWGMMMGGVLPMFVVLYLIKPHLVRFH